MSNFRTISFLTALLLSVPSTNATNLYKTFKRGASATLEQREQAAAVITVDNGGLNPQQLNHDFSGRKLEYRMRLVNKASGEDLGSITCTISHLGHFISSVFDR